MASNHGSGGPRLRVVRYMECKRNVASESGGHVVDGCRVFQMNRAVVGTPESEFCGSCGCHRNFHRREEYLPGHLAADHALHRLAAAAAAISSPLPPLPPRRPRPQPPPPAQPAIAPESAKPNTGSETPRWEERGEETKPPKKRRTNTEAGEASSTPSTGV